MITTWSLVPIGDMANRIERSVVPTPGKQYRQIGVRLWGQGAYERKILDGAQTRYQTLFRVESGDIIVNKIWARNGSVAVVTDELSGCYGSGEFPIFSPNREHLNPRWFHWITKTSWFWRECDLKSRGTSGKNRIRPEKFLEIQIPLPPVEQQRRIVAKIDELTGKINQSSKLKNEINNTSRLLLQSSFTKITANAKFIPMHELAPITRRPVDIDLLSEYPELGIRSFGNGTFHKPALTGAAVGSKKLFRIEPGDLVFNNVFAWEGAIAVAKEEDFERFGSHRFITCLPKKGLATPEFLCFYFLTSEGLEKLGEASPGGAGRNRTLGLDALSKIEVPVPPIDQQLWFDSLQKKVKSLKMHQEQTSTQLAALLPSILDKAIKGEL
jgi:type I restriction enzyme S subunit